MTAALTSPPPRDVIFLSHATPEDNAFTRWLGAKLTALGYQIWSDITRLHGGADWSRDLEGSIRRRAIKMPAIARAENGLDLLAWMRQKPDMREVPVIAVTAHALVAEQERMLQAGCRACFSKPINFEGLREQLSHWLQDRAVSRPNS